MSAAAPATVSRSHTGMGLRLTSATALIAFDERQTVIVWNRAAEALTGIAASEAIGKPCWQMLAGRDDAGAVVCHRGCARGRLAREGWPSPAEHMHVRCGSARRRVALETIAVAGIEKPFYMHLVNEAPAPAAGEDPPPPPGPAPRLTPRQLDVLGLIAQGMRARAIAVRLGVAEPTVRNHIRAVLAELGAHSQTQAVYLARRHRLL